MFGSGNRSVKANDIAGSVFAGDVHVTINVATPGHGTPVALPWRTPQNKDPIASLRWTARIAPLTGRDEVKASLLDWARSDVPSSIRLLSGPGGVGKTRLAAEVADELRKDENKTWTAGFFTGSAVTELALDKPNTLLIIDYPEARRPWVEALLRAVGEREDDPDHRLRLLLLSRQGREVWDDSLRGCGCDALVSDIQLDALPPLTNDEEAWHVFIQARARLAERGFPQPVEVTQTAFTVWLDRRPLHRLPLFVTALALHAALTPERAVLDLDDVAILTALADRERDRLRGLAEGAGFVPEALERVMALAAVSGRVSRATLTELAARHPEIGLGDPARVVDRIARAGLTTDPLEPPQPDLLAAVFAARTLGKRADCAPEWLWTAFEPDIAEAIANAGRLTYDAEYILGLPAPHTSDALAAMVAGKLDRCGAVEPHLRDHNLPHGLLPLAVAAGQPLADLAEDEEEKAWRLNNLSADLSEVGDGAGALAAIREAAAIYQRLAEHNPARVEPDLAGSLINLSNHLYNAGDGAGALATIREAVAVYRRLAGHNPALFEPNLAGSLINLSSRLSEVGDGAGALAAIREAVAVYHRLAGHNPACFEPDFARSLNNLSIRLNDAGDGTGALAAIRDAVDLRRRLARHNPARFEPDLARSLNNLSAHLSGAGDGVGALTASREAVAVYRRLAEHNPARFEADLAMSLNNLSNHLSEVGDGAEALASARETVAVYRRLAGHNQARFSHELGMALYFLADRLVKAENPAAAMEVLREGIPLVEPIAAQYPKARPAAILQRMRESLARIEALLAPASPAAP